MLNSVFWDSSKWTLLAPQKNRSDLSYYKVEQNFGLIENFICSNQINYQQINKLLFHIGFILMVVWRVLQIILWLWQHPRPYII